MSQHPVLLRLLDDAVGFRRRPGFAPDHMVTATGSPSALLVLAANPEELRAPRAEAFSILKSERSGLQSGLPHQSCQR